VIADGSDILGYCCLSAGAISHEAVPKPMRRTMPDLLPVLLLGRLAIDQRYHNQGLGVRRDRNSGTHRGIAFYWLFPLLSTRPATGVLAGTMIVAGQG
jgi:hypothetical protein